MKTKSNMTDKQKTDWEKEFNKRLTKLFQWWYEITPENINKRRNQEDEMKQFIKQTLTQQRTELLEEIKKEKQIKFKDIINSANMLLGMNGFRLTFDGEMLGLIDERLIKNTNLLNKKDE